MAFEEQKLETAMCVVESDLR